MNKKLTKQEEKELIYLIGEFEKTICSCCPEYKLRDWKQKRLDVLWPRFEKWGAERQ